MPQCAVSTCGNTHRRTRGGSVRYHRFPGDAKTRARWIAACGRPRLNCATARVCSRHFGAANYERDVQHELLGLPQRCRLRKGAVPDRELPEAEEAAAAPESSAIAVLLAVGLMPNGDVVGDRDVHASNKMKIMDDDKEEAKSESTEDPDASEKPNGSSDHNDKTERANAEITEDKTNDVEINYADIDTLSEKNKRKLEDDETSVKRLKHEIHENFQQRDKLLNELLEIMDCDNLDQLASYSDQIVAEIGTLNELAKEKETEWNNVVHLKKLKEELLIRVERKKQLALLNGEKLDDGRDFAEMYIRNNQSIIGRANLAKDRAPKYPLPNGLDLRQGIKRPILDVQSIIADYRQRHPETVPRRGRRIRTGAPNGTTNGNAGILNFSSMALGSGAQVRHNDMGNELNLLLNALENNRDNASAKEKHNSENASFKDMLVQLAKLSQNERNEILQNAIKPPPPYPEVTVHPVPNSPPSNSLLHGILTKAASSKSNNKTSFSPTLARLLTAPERSNVTSTPSITGHVNSNMSLSDILSTNKARNEITITPVGNQFDGSIKAKMEDEEAEDSADRLVIDESNEIDGRKGDTGSDTGDEVPQCQGCNQKTAQFVCAGCGNQWYCSRDCQVAAWDEHSEVCSG